MLRAVADFSSTTSLTPAQVSGAGGVIILGNQGVPLVMPGSGLMIANGVGTLTTALASTPAITSCYAYFALNAIASGVPAGWYYTVFTTTTAFTVFNNTYTTGTPVIPASPTAFVTTSPVSYTGASSALAAYQLPIAGNTLGLNGGLRVGAAFSYTNSAANKGFTISYGSLALLSDSQTTTTNLAGIWGFKNQGATGSQIATVNNGAGALNTGTTLTLSSGTVDTTSAQTLSVTLTNSTPATNNMVLTNTTVELLPSVA